MPSHEGPRRRGPLRRDYRFLSGAEEVGRSLACAKGHIIYKESFMMLGRFICGILSLLVPLLALRAGDGLRADQEPDRLFREGKFSEAEALYSQIQARDPSNFQAALRLGTISLLKNRLGDAK